MEIGHNEAASAVKPHTAKNVMSNDMDMNYIQVDSGTLELSCTAIEPDEGFLIPTAKTRHDVLERAFHGLVYHNVLYGYRIEEDEAKGKRGIAYSLVNPDPWLIALAAIMWQGLIQGMTWDVIKLSVLKGLDFLRAKGLAPDNVPRNNILETSRQETRSTLELGFSWTQFSQDGEPLEKFFLGVRREFEKKRDEERKSIKRQHKKMFNS